MKRLNIETMPLGRLGMFTGGALALLLAAGGAVATGDEPAFDDTPREPMEWGFRPSDEAVAMTPPGFVWRPQEDAEVYQLQIAATGEDGDERVYQVANWPFNVHTPPETLEPGRYWWRVRYRTEGGERSAWSERRTFEVRDDATPYPLPTKRELLDRLPEGHPRLFLRPDDLEHWRELADGRLSENYQALIDRAERILADPTPTDEPEPIPDDVERGSDEWRETYWGNRHHAADVMNEAVTLAFAWRLSEDDRYAEAARAILLDVANWDPQGSTGRAQNDEAAMTLSYLYARAYTFLHDHLSEQDREQCRAMMRVRGNDFHQRLRNLHLMWRPYRSHANRMWHFLGEMAIAFHGEIPETEDWLWYGMNYYFAIYPVWGDEDGGWHEGAAYFSSYLTRFTWWADIMNAAFDINAYDKPFFASAGYYPMYMLPPGTTSGGFGDQAQNVDSQRLARIVRLFASQARHPYWQWYAEANDEGEPDVSGSYLAFARAAQEPMEAEPPHEMDADYHFRGIGRAVLNSNLLDGRDNFQIIFKSAPQPFGTASHGYEAHNAFLMRLFGQRLFIRSGVRDTHGSDHHRQWMWHTRSTNNITVNEQSQVKRSREHSGRITAFQAGDPIAYVEGEASGGFKDNVEHFRRGILMIKPRFALVFDRLRTEQPSQFQWRLHTLEPMQDLGDGRVLAQIEDAACLVAFVEPASSELRHERGTDPPSRRGADHARVVVEPRGSADRMDFLTLFWPHEASEQVEPAYELEQSDDAYVLTVALQDGREATIELARALPHERNPSQQPHDIVVVVRDETGEPIARFESDGVELD